MQARRKIAVAGATGRAGHHVAGVLEARPNATLAGPTFQEWLDSPQRLTRR